jgi:quercetin dioxygenase-like cupin family protein
MKRAPLPLLLSALLLAQATEVEITAEPHHHLVFSNDQIRVFNVEVPPSQATLMHWHHHDYFYVTLGDIDLTNEVEGKPPAEVKLKDGETRFSPGPFAHLVRDLSPQPFRNVTIELMQDDKLRQSPAHWDEDRGLNVLQGGTREIIFVKDGVRVSEVELQPGGMIPAHHHSGPHFAVAVTDYQLRSDRAGKPAEKIEMKAGESRWFAGNYSHTVTNVGHTSAKYVTLEFP